MKNKKFGALSSSTNPEQIANTVKGAVLMSAGIIVFLARMFNFPLTETEIVNFASQLGIVIGAIWTVYGLVMKFVVSANEKYMQWRS